MAQSDNVSPLRPLLIGSLVGLIIGLIIGLTWAWVVDPVVYSGGAYPNEMSDSFKKAYVSSVAEAFLNNRDPVRARSRLLSFDVPEKVALLAGVASDFASQGLTTEADGVGDLAQALNAQEAWPADSVSAGLLTAAANSQTGLDTFSAKLGQAPLVGGAVPQPVADSGSSALGRLLRTLLIIFLVLLLLAAIVFMLLRIKPKRRTSKPQLSAELAAWDGTGPQPLRQWVGNFTIGQDTFDESFTVETEDGDFLGECGMGILDGFASGSPKKVTAFDVWLFDKTDIRTVSMPIMSQFAYEDDILRSKLPPDATPVLAVEGQTFDIETTALIVKAKIDEVVYGEDKPEMSYFDSIKVSLTAYLKPDVDVSGAMPLPEGMS